MDMDNKRDIELYENRQVQELIGHVPAGVLRWGVYVIASFVVVLLAGSCFFQYPETLKGTIVIPCSDDTALVYGILFLPPANVGEIKEGAKVHAFPEAYPEAKYGFLTGEVWRINGIPDEAGRYRVEVRFPQGLRTSQGYALSPKLQMSGSGEVVLKESRLIEALIGPVRLVTRKME